MAENPAQDSRPWVGFEGADTLSPDEQSVWEGHKVKVIRGWTEHGKRITTIEFRDKGTDCPAWQAIGGGDE